MRRGSLQADGKNPEGAFHGHHTSSITHTFDVHPSKVVGRMMVVICCYLTWLAKFLILLFFPPDLPSRHARPPRPPVGLPGPPEAAEQGGPRQGLAAMKHDLFFAGHVASPAQSSVGAHTCHRIVVVWAGPGPSA